MLNVNELIGFGANIDGSPFASLQSLTSISASATSYSFSNVNSGNPSFDRYIIVACGFEGASDGSPTTCTVDGNPTTRVAFQNGVLTTAIFITNAPVTTGTTANVVINTSVQYGRGACGVFSATGKFNTTPSSTLNDATIPLSGSINLYSQGFVIGVAAASIQSNFTWSNLTEIGEVFPGSSATVSYALENIKNSETRTVGTGGTTAAYESFSVASWQKA